MQQDFEQIPQFKELYTEAELKSLQAILMPIIQDLGLRIGMYAQETLSDIHYVSAFKRYKVLSNFLYGETNPYLRDFITRNKEINITEFTVGNGLAIIGLLTSNGLFRMLLGKEAKKLNLVLNDLQLTPLRITYLQNWFERYGIDWIKFTATSNDVRQPPSKVDPKRNLGIFCYTHYYLTVEEYIQAILYRLAECEVLFTAPLSFYSDTQGKMVEGLFLYREDGIIKSWQDVHVFES